MKPWRAILVMLTCVLAARADINTGFEPPLVIGSPVGQVLTGQDGWNNPIPGSTDFRAFTYAGNQFGFPANPTGGQQFIAGISQGGIAFARAERINHFAAGDVWSMSFDVAVKFPGAPPASNDLGGLSLQNSASTKSFTVLLTWTDPGNPSSWQLGYLVHDASGVQVPAPGLIAGPAWANLVPNRWYRVSTVWKFSSNVILSVSITDLATGASATQTPTGWFLAGGAGPALPFPTAVRLFTGGAVPGNIVAWDNVDLCPLRVSAFNPPAAPEGAIVQIDGCGFGSVADDLSVAMVMPDGTGIPFTVLSATDTRLFARVGPVPHDAVPGPIAVARGLGQRGINPPSLDDVIPENPDAVLVWTRAGDRAVSSSSFIPQPSPPPPGQVFFSGRRTLSGSLELVIDGNRPPNTSLRLFAKLHATASGIGADVEADEVRLRCGGDAQYTAERVRDAVLTALATRGINAACSLLNTGPNQRTLILTLLDPGSLPIPINVGAFSVVAGDPSAVSPFAIGPVSGFYQAQLTQPGSSAQVNNVDGTGEDGASISPVVPTASGIVAKTLPIDLNLVGESFTVRSWGTLNGSTPNQLIQVARVDRTAAGLALSSNPLGVGTSLTRLEVWHNAVLVGSSIIPGPAVAGVTAGTGGLPRIVGAGARPAVSPNPPLLWIDLEFPATITPAGGAPLTGNQVRLLAHAPADAATNLQATDLAAGLLDPADIHSFVIFNSYEGGICYGNCDGSSGFPVLTANDFQCFLNAFAAGAPYANCDGSTGVPSLTANDFQCFLNAFAAGCP